MSHLECHLIKLWGDSSSYACWFLFTGNTKSIRAYFDEEMPYVMDAKTSGNLGRYLNVSFLNL